MKAETSKNAKLHLFVLSICLASIWPARQAYADYPYAIVDTGQATCYDNYHEITCPQPGEIFHGQDAQYDGPQPAYQDNGDGTITDLNTGLMWQQTPDIDNKSTYPEAVAGAETFNLAGYDDWRLPTIKELYSLIDFSGSTGMSAQTSVPYIDTDYFDFEYGDESAGERFIDAQYWSSTEYVGTTMNGAATVFGVNFADGRIKGYPRDTGPGGSPKTEFVRYVRGNPDYGVNNFVDNNDGTVTDLATGLMWQKTDSGATMNWRQALDYAENLEHAGYDDWQLPNAKELQGIVDYTRAPDAADPAYQSAAIDPVFDLTETESWFWTGTTHVDGPDASYAAYICFGQAFGYMPDPFGGTNYMNVHGAGAQRSDPKSGDPADWPTGHGPQGDEIRIYNYVRCLRSADCADLPCDCPCMGDMNDDGWVSPSDVSNLVSVLLPYKTAYYYTPAPLGSCGDTNGDGWLSPTDAGNLVSLLLPYESAHYWKLCD